VIWTHSNIRHCYAMKQNGGKVYLPLIIVWITYPLSKNKKYSFTRNYPLWSLNKETTSRFSKEQTSLGHSNFLFKSEKKWSDWFLIYLFRVIMHFWEKLMTLILRLNGNNWGYSYPMNGDKMTSKIHLYITHLIVASCVFKVILKVRYGKFY